MHFLSPALVSLLRPLNSVLPPTGAMNPYQSTIAAVGGILDNYDSDKLYPVYGFGAKVQLGWTSQCCAGVIKLLRANTEHWSWITDYSGQLFACNSRQGEVSLLSLSLEGIL
jgi:hypothetical protein